MLVGLLVATVLAATARADSPDPGTLVLRQSDVPATFKLDAAKSGLRTRKQDAVDTPGLPAQYERWGHVLAYQRRFVKGDDSIVSRVDLFRKPSGSSRMFAWFVAAAQRQNSAIRMRAAPVALGDEGIAYGLNGSGLRLNLYAWRYRRVFSVVGGSALARTRVLALARLQQQRVAAALR